MASVSLRAIAKNYDGINNIIHGIDLNIRDGEFMVFVGPSGCGKTTMMRMIAGLEDITGGELYIGDQLSNQISPVDRGVAMVFQSYALYPHMTVFDNMGFGLKISGSSKQAVKDAVGRAADILHITHLLDRKPKALSGGQRQRVAIGRAIVRKPKVFLFDEPLSNLDAALRVQMRVELSKLHKELGTTMIYVTHDQTEAMTMGDRIAVFNKGKIEQVGPPMDLYRQPINTFVAGFLGSPMMNFLPCTISRGDGEQLVLRIGESGTIILEGTTAVVAHAAALASGSVTVGIRPESFEIAPAGDGLPVEVELVEHLGDTLMIYARLPGVEKSLSIKVQETDFEWCVGKKLCVRPKAGSCHLFNEAGSSLSFV
ncbi:ABC transporter ATP-binding protein [Glaciimonas immobilis]|uniref:Multiple sugar transport system ATP-binding protein n=1 Tax=Glaciimonas immobilis TaxID=728004 RepID=A0A840RLG8_9BURK|nr:sn-glycerol-3-phosphate ABC transporter ATP-binding protein UgpC [Glaciimonas immobilis]KAF3999157.1 sn-glycerol-3-phosphate ABC transporter ATP-binding protein UgpC [Glaciimonas immobilis]MBB5198603.1 multiple sugar transport system ATP-binding protein [Glaciimonas immobilis]